MRRRSRPLRPPRIARSSGRCGAARRDAGNSAIFGGLAWDARRTSKARRSSARRRRRRPVPARHDAGDQLRDRRNRVRGGIVSRGTAQMIASAVRDPQRWPLLLSVALATACTLDPLGKDGCAVDDDCISGYVCEQGSCARRTGDGGGGGRGGGAGGTATAGTFGANASAGAGGSTAGGGRGGANTDGSKGGGIGGDGTGGSAGGTGGDGGGGTGRGGVTTTGGETGTAGTSKSGGTGGGDASGMSSGGGGGTSGMSGNGGGGASACPVTGAAACPEQVGA